jgi:5-methylcytosine-specific restriction endonuclease McrA
MLVPLREARRNKRWTEVRKGRPRDLTKRLVWAFGARCQYCGRYGNSRGIQLDDPDGHILYWTADRIDPSGTYDPENVTLACNSCNGRKGHRLPDFPVVSLAMMEVRP